MVLAYLTIILSERELYAGVGQESGHIALSNTTVLSIFICPYQLTVSIISFVCLSVLLIKINSMRCREEKSLSLVVPWKAGKSKSLFIYQ